MDRVVNDQTSTDTMNSPDSTLVHPTLLKSHFVRPAYLGPYTLSNCSRKLKTVPGLTKTK